MSRYYLDFDKFCFDMQDLAQLIGNSLCYMDRLEDNNLPNNLSYYTLKYKVDKRELSLIHLSNEQLKVMFLDMVKHNDITKEDMQDLEDWNSF